VEKIESSQLVEMEYLVLTTWALRKWQDLYLSQNSDLLLTIFEWLQAFAVYVAIIAKKQPHEVPGLIGYQILMLEASIEYQNIRWIAYDRCFQQQAASISGST